MLVSRTGVYFEPHLHQFAHLAKCVSFPDIFTTDSVQKNTVTWRLTIISFSPFLVWQTYNIIATPYCYLSFYVYICLGKIFCHSGWIVMNIQDTYIIRRQYHSLPADATTWSMMYIYIPQEKRELKCKVPDTLRRISVLVGSLAEDTWNM